MARKTEM